MRPPDNLTKAEETLLAAVAEGTIADFRTGDLEQDEPAKGAGWGVDRSLRAEVIRSLCLNAWDHIAPDPKGIRIQGARITGKLDLEAVRLEVPLCLHHCRIEEQAVFRHMSANLVGLNGSFLVAGIQCDGVGIEHDLLMSEGFAAEGVVSLVGTDIGGQLSCRGGSFKNPKGYALFAERMSVKGGVFLCEGFAAEGEVSLAGANIGGNFECDGSSLENPEGNALSAYGMTVRGNVFLRQRFVAKGAVNLIGADIGGQLSCRGGSFKNSEGHALFADAITVKGGVFLSEDFAEVRLGGANIGGTLNCDGARFKNPKGYVLVAENMTVKGSVLLRQCCVAKGAVSLLDANIVGSLECIGSTFDALSADRMTVMGNVSLSKDFVAKGAVRLGGARIGGQLSCRRGTFDALLAQNMTVKGAVLFDEGFAAKGEVNLLGADIGGSLNCDGARFEKHEGDAFVLCEASVAGTLHWTNLNSQGSVDLRHAKVGQLEDDTGSWPKDGQLELDGFQYAGFGPGASREAKDRIKWLELQPEFRSQPYEQLIRVLRQLGRERDARKIAIAKQINLRRSGQLSLLGRLWSLFMCFTVAYGYEPQRAVWGALAMILFGSLMFWSAEQQGAMVPTKIEQHSGEQTTGTDATVPAEYPAFTPFVYSLDAFLPIVDLHQEAYWLPRKTEYLIYMWVHILTGWALTTVIVAALSGLIKKD